VSRLEERIGKFVVPGEVLGIIEEFLPGPGTYVDEESGEVRAARVGHLLLNLPKREVIVHPAVPVTRIPRVGGSYIGLVTAVTDKQAIIRFNTNPKSTDFFTGILSITAVSRRFVKSMFEVCRPGDVVRVAVISNKNRLYHLSMLGKHLGVVYAYCTDCGYPLTLKGRELYCPACGRVERRKVAVDYGRVWRGGGRREA